MELKLRVQQALAGAARYPLWLVALAPVRLSLARTVGELCVVLFDLAGFLRPAPKAEG
jgi:hypothetical protein